MSPDANGGPVDFHCHLDLCGDMEEAFSVCDNLRCITLTVTTTPKAFERNRMMASRTKHVKAALGLHPQLVAQRSSEIALFEELVASTRFIGEIGLDAGRRFYPSFERQKEVFERALNICAKQGDKVISLHSVRTAKHVLDAIERSRVHRSCQPILHWFTASGSEIRRAHDLGCLFSVNEQMLRTPKGQALLDIVPLGSLLTETDAPFQSTNNKANSPGDVDAALALIAQAYQSELTVVSHHIRKTAEMLTNP